MLMNFSNLNFSNSLHYCWFLTSFHCGISTCSVGFHQLDIYRALFYVLIGCPSQRLSSVDWEVHSAVVGSSCLQIPAMSRLVCSVSIFCFLFGLLLIVHTLLFYPLLQVGYYCLQLLFFCIIHFLLSYISFFLHVFEVLLMLIHI